VKIARNPADADMHAIGDSRDDIKGLTVKKVLVAEAVEIASEAYVGVVSIARSPSCAHRLAAGGVEIEEVAEEDPGEDHQIAAGSTPAVQPFQARRVAYANL